MVITSVVLFVLAIVLVLFLLRLYKRLKDSENANRQFLKELELKNENYRECLQDISERDKKLAILEDKVRRLSPFQKILDVEKSIRERREEYLRLENQAREKAKESIRAQRKAVEDEKSAHKQELAESRQEMREKRTAFEEQQSNLLASASRESSRIIDGANVRAEAIAGDALRALRDAKRLEDTAKAMKNIISGYGDEYLVPSASVLDDLAEDFTHKEAGVSLKTARARVKEMVSTGKAANCSYAEARRKETAIHFILDAFNGKVDSILSMAKHDNYGKLAQEIEDAFNLVNHNGAAFRDAHITPEYLDARHQELRWAVATIELRNIEREEQRAIKQAMREEERARREYEKAIKEAEKEEKLLQKAMEKARSELESANDDQRAEFENKLRELEEKLVEAEAKNQRAMSLAQQTKRGHVYVISNIGSFGEDVFKIGLTRRLEPLDRVKELGDASVPFEFDVHALIFSEDAPALESELHREFSISQVNKVNSRKEFFRVNLGNIKELLENKGISAHWTMAAEAKEYRETLAIERGASVQEETGQIALSQ